MNFCNFIDTFSSFHSLQSLKPNTKLFTSWRINSLSINDNTFLNTFLNFPLFILLFCFHNFLKNCIRLICGQSGATKHQKQIIVIHFQCVTRRKIFYKHTLKHSICKMFLSTFWRVYRRFRVFWFSLHWIFCKKINKFFWINNHFWLNI